MNNIHNLLESYAYNREEHYMLSLVDAIIKRLKGQYQILTDEVREDCDIIYGFIVLTYGDYGTSPRYGWFDDVTKLKEIELELINYHKEVELRIEINYGGDTNEIEL